MVAFSLLVSGIICIDVQAADVSYDEADEDGSYGDRLRPGATVISSTPANALPTLDSSMFTMIDRGGGAVPQPQCLFGIQKSPTRRGKTGWHEVCLKIF